MNKIDNSIKFTSINIGLVTISDSRNEDNDKSGNLLKDKINNFGHKVYKKIIIKDDLDLIKKTISSERLEKIQNILFKNQIEMNKSLKNKIIDVLVENITDDKTKAFGRSEYMTSVIFNGTKSDIGKIVKVRIKDSNRNTLFGDILTHSGQKVA